MSVQRMCSGDAALVPASLRGYRMWDVAGMDLLATNFGHGTWDDGYLRAECFRGLFDVFGVGSGQHDAPAQGCGCGIYGWYRPDEARLHAGAIFGVIEASGRVLLGDFGFRAEKARAVALAYPDAPADFVAHWAARGVRVFPSREALVAVYPPEDVTDLIGHPIPDTPDCDVFTFAASLTFTVDVTQFTAAMKAFGQSAHTTGYAFTQLAKAWPEADDPPEWSSMDPKERALALSKRGTRGPEKRRRGRARLSLD